MNGSKTIKDRLFILKNVEKIIFVSQWVKDRFFLDLDLKLKTKTEKSAQTYSFLFSSKFLKNNYHF